LSQQYIPEEEPPESYFLEELHKMPVEPLQWIVEDFVLAKDAQRIVW
jgi:hypothetical protein